MNYHDHKRDYLVKTLSRTKKKDYENYIINAIWQKLDCLDLKPCTQHCVRFSNNKYALIDLYFPQLNYGVECDEFHHTKNQKNDFKRELSIQDVLDSTDANNSFVLRRIRAYEDMNSIHQQIDEIVDEIKTLKKNINFVPWELKTKHVVIRKNFYSINDEDRYRLIVDVANALGKNYKGLQKAYFPIKDNIYAWCPQLAVMVNDKMLSQNGHDWLNYLSDDWNTIFETRSNKTEMKDLKLQDENNRVTFVKSKDESGNNTHRFIGVYEFNSLNSTKELRVYKRISTDFEL